MRYPTDKCELESSGQIEVHRYQDGTIVMKGKLKSSTNDFRFSSDLIDNEYKKVIRHGPKARCGDDSLPWAEVNADAAYAMKLDATWTTDDLTSMGTGGKVAVTGHVVLYTQNISGSAMKQHWFQCVAKKDAPMQLRLASKFGWDSSYGMSGGEPEGKNTQTRRVSGEVTAELKWADHESHSFMPVLIRNGRTTTNGAVGYLGMTEISVFLNDGVCTFTAEIRHRKVDLAINTECHPHASGGKK